MNDQAVQFFRTITTDVEAAETLLNQHSAHTQRLLRAVAAQNAVVATYTARPKPAQIRALCARMRRRFDEPIDAYVIATMIDSVLQPDSPNVQSRLATLDLPMLHRMALLLPCGLFADASTATIEQWARATGEHYERSAALMAETDPDTGDFYRLVCLDPLTAAKRLYNDTSITTQRQTAMAVHTAIGALCHAYPEGPTTADRNRLLTYLQQRYDDIPTDTFNTLFADAFTPDQNRLLYNTDLYALSMVIPSAIAVLHGWSSEQIDAFVSDCHQIDAAFDAALARGGDRP